jgi:hypothetical protein
MKKKIVYSKMLVEIALNERTRANEVFYKACSEDDETAERLRRDLKSVLVDLLNGNFEPVTQRLAQYAKRPTEYALRPVGPYRDGVNVKRKKVRIGSHEAIFVEIQSPGAEPEELIYGFVLLNSLKMDDIQRLDLCKVCRGLFYRKNVSGVFCGDKCRWSYYNEPERRHERYAKAVRKRLGLSTRVHRRKAFISPKRTKTI